LGIIDPEVSLKVQSELMPGESLLWTGRPNPRVVFHSDDLYLVPFSLLWGGFAIFWEMGVLGYWGNGPKGGTASAFMSLWGIPFVAAGQYMIWGRFFYDGWLKRRTYYSVTDRRVLVVQEGWKRKTSWMYIDAIPTIEREGTTAGTLWFEPRYPVLARAWTEDAQHEPFQHRRFTSVCGYRRFRLSVPDGPGSQGKKNCERRN